MSVNSRLDGHLQGSTQAEIKAWWVGGVWAEFVTISIDYLPHIKVKPTVRHRGATMSEGPEQKTDAIRSYIYMYCYSFTVQQVAWQCIHDVVI